MKKFYLLLITVMSFVAATAQTHFTPAFEGNGTDHMNIYIVESTIETAAMEVGDEIAVFDGDVCAGVLVLTQAYVDGALGAINASKADSLTAGNGYVEGHTISFKFWDASEQTEYDNVDITFVDNETGQEIAPVPFTVGASVFVKLNMHSGTALGNTEVYGLTSMNTSRKAMPVTFSEDGKISSISIYHNGGTGNMLLGVYSDESGYPGTMLGVTASTSVNSGEGWQTVVLTDSVSVYSGETVWLSFVFENAVGTRYTAGTPGRAVSPDGWGSGMPVEFGTSSKADYTFSIYCTYSVVINSKSAELETPVLAENPEFGIQQDNFTNLQILGLKAYPNPFMNELKIEFNKKPDERLQLSIYDIQGRMLMQMENELAEGFNRLVWNRNDSMGNRVKSGIYMVQLISDTRREVFKVVCQGD